MNRENEAINKDNNRKPPEGFDENTELSADGVNPVSRNDEAPAADIADEDLFGFPGLFPPAFFPGAGGQPGSGYPGFPGGPIV